MLPIWHFYQHKYSATFLATMQQREEDLPWHKRQQQAVFFAGDYHRWAVRPAARAALPGRVQAQRAAAALGAARAMQLPQLPGSLRPAAPHAAQPAAASLTAAAAARRQV
jgi:hypothetical protein